MMRTSMVSTFLPPRRRTFFDSMARSSFESKKVRSEEHTSELQSHLNHVCRLLLEKKRNEFLHLLNAARRRLGGSSDGDSVGGLHLASPSRIQAGHPPPLTPTLPPTQTTIPTRLR